MRVLNGQVIKVHCFAKLVKKVAQYFIFVCITFPFLGILGNVIFMGVIMCLYGDEKWLGYHDMTYQLISQWC